MSPSAQFLNPSEAAERLGVSPKALRIYEQRGLLAPIRTVAGWRVYGPVELARAAEIAALRVLGLSLGEVGRVLGGDARGLETALAAHQASLEDRARQLADTLAKVRGLRADLANGRAPAATELAHLLRPTAEVVVAFDLPWPWGGERFELRDIRLLNYIIGPLGSGKTRLAQRLAESLPDAAFLGLERLADGGVSARMRLAADAALQVRVDATLAWLVEEGASMSEALVALLTGLVAAGPAILVVDKLEQGLDKATQEAVIAHLRHRGHLSGLAGGASSDRRRHRLATTSRVRSHFALAQACAGVIAACSLGYRGSGPTDGILAPPTSHRAHPEAKKTSRRIKIMTALRAIARIALVAAALALQTGASQAASDIFLKLQQSAPRSGDIFADINASAPRSTDDFFGDLAKSAPRSDVFGDLAKTAPRGDGLFADIGRTAP